MKFIVWNCFTDHSNNLVNYKQFFIFYSARVADDPNNLFSILIDEGKKQAGKFEIRNFLSSRYSNSAPLDLHKSERVQTGPKQVPAAADYKQQVTIPPATMNAARKRNTNSAAHRAGLVASIAGLESRIDLGPDGGAPQRRKNRKPGMQVNFELAKFGSG